MKRLTGIAGAILLEVMVNALCANLMFAVPGGFTGRTLLTSNSGCGGCHGSSPNTGVQAIITGPSSLAPGQTASYTIKVTVGVSTSTKAGVDIAVSDGTLAPVSSQLQLSGGEITHNTRLVRGTEYTFNYTAPVSGGSVTIYATVAGDPNPFNPSTAIQFSVAQTGRSTLQVFDPLGQPVATLFDDATEAGNLYNVRFDGANLASGTYFYRLQSRGRVSLKKLVLLR